MIFQPNCSESVMRLSNTEIEEFTDQWPNKFLFKIPQILKQCEVDISETNLNGHNPSYLEDTILTYCKILEEGIPEFIWVIFDYILWTEDDELRSYNEVDIEKIASILANGLNMYQTGNELNDYITLFTCPYFEYDYSQKLE